MKNNPYYLYCALMIGIMIGVGSMLLDNHFNYIKAEQPKIKPCNCLTYYEWQTLSTKRDMIIDKRKRSRVDSLRLDSINVALWI